MNKELTQNEKLAIAFEMIDTIPIDNLVLASLKKILIHGIELNADKITCETITQVDGKHYKVQMVVAFIEQK